MSFLIGAACIGQILAQIGTFSLLALLPSLTSEWALSNTEAEWLSGIFCNGYAVSLPVLISLTDRDDAKRIYLFGVAIIALSLYREICSLRGWDLFHLCISRLVGIGMSWNLYAGHESIERYRQRPLAIPRGLHPCRQCGN